MPKTRSAAALKVKTKHADAQIIYVRRANRRGDARTRGVTRSRMAMSEVDDIGTVDEFATVADARSKVMLMRW